jgi:hypothetical protein
MSRLDHCTIASPAGAFPFAAFASSFLKKNLVSDLELKHRKVKERKAT